MAKSLNIMFRVWCCIVFIRMVMCWCDFEARAQPRNKDDRLFAFFLSKPPYPSSFLLNRWIWCLLLQYVDLLRSIVCNFTQNSNNPFCSRHDTHMRFKRELLKHTNSIERERKKCISLWSVLAVNWIAMRVNGLFKYRNSLRVDCARLQNLKWNLFMFNA